MSQNFVSMIVEIYETFAIPFVVSKRHMLHDILNFYFLQLFKICHRIVFINPLTVNIFLEVLRGLNTSKLFASKNIRNLKIR